MAFWTLERCISSKKSNGLSLIIWKCHGFHLFKNIINPHIKEFNFEVLFESHFMSSWITILHLTLAIWSYLLNGILMHRGWIIPIIKDFGGSSYSTIVTTERWGVENLKDIIHLNLHNAPPNHTIHEKMKKKGSQVWMKMLQVRDLTDHLIFWRLKEGSHKVWYWSGIVDLY